MTVKELIEKLKTLDQNKRIIVYGGGIANSIFNIEQLADKYYIYCAY